MCVIALDYKAHAGTLFVLAANRDESFLRPSLALAPWEDDPDIIGGRDLEAGGSWMALHKNGRFAAVTNVRMGFEKKAARSRGLLVTDFLRGDCSTLEFAKQLRATDRDYAPFNLLFGRVDDLYVYHSVRHALTRLTHGVFTVSNGAPDAAWPKTERLRQAFEAAKRLPSDDEMLGWLRDGSSPPVESLPNTGVGMALEKMFAPVFIQTPDYGTRASTVIRVSSRGTASLREVGFHAGRAIYDQTFSLKLELQS